MATRSNYYGVTVNNGANTLRPNTVVSITVHGGGAANIYTAETGGSVSTGSVTSDANGIINVWLDPGKYDITPSGGQTRVYDTGQGSVAGGDLTGSFPGPTIASGVVTDTKVAAANKDGLPTVPSMRTLGPGAQQAMAGNATPGGVPSGAAGGDLFGSYPSPSIAKDGVAGVATMRTLGGGAQQAAAGNDSRLSDLRAPTNSSVTLAKLAAAGFLTNISGGQNLQFQIATNNQAFTSGTAGLNTNQIVTAFPNAVVACIQANTKWFSDPGQTAVIGNPNSWIAYDVYSGNQISVSYVNSAGFTLYVRTSLFLIGY